MKQLKRWTGCSLVILILTGLFPVSGFAQETLPIDASTASVYGEVLTGEIGQYGITDGREDPANRSPADKGIQYAGLIDMNEDGTDELVIFRYESGNAANIGIWTCKNGQAVKTAEHNVPADGWVMNYVIPMSRYGEMAIYIYASEEFLYMDGSVSDVHERVILDLDDAFAYGEGTVWFYNEKRAKAVSELQADLEKRAKQQGAGGAGDTGDAGDAGAGTSVGPGPVSVPSDWARSLAAEADGAKIVPDSVKVDYHRAITRAQFAEMAVQAIEAGGMTLPKGDAFADCSLDYVLKARAAGIVSGSGNNMFEPDSFILREEMAAMIVNTSQYMMKQGGYSYISGINDAEAEESIMARPEYQEVSDWARKFMRRAQDEGLILGTGSGFAPRQNTTCEEAVIIAWKAAHPYIDAMKGAFDPDKYFYIKDTE